MKLLAPHFEPYAGQIAEHILMQKAFAQAGISYHPFDATEQDLPEGDAVLWQGVSNYYRRMDRLEGLLTQAEQRGIFSFNSPSLIRWNARKTYLKELEAKRIAFLPTLWLESFNEVAISTWAAQKNITEIVIKPVISAGAYLTFRVNLSRGMDEAKEAYRAMPETALMVQPFAPEIETDGEWSFLFFGGEFSHAVRKTPKVGDYRIQHVHGGSYERVMPNALLLHHAQKVLAALPENPVYARVDGIRRGDQFLLMEVELIEPYFYLDAAPEKVQMLVQAVGKLSEKTVAA